MNKFNKEIAILFFMLGLISRVQAQDSITKNLDMTRYVFQDTEGHDVSLKDFKGNYVYLDVWASWCRPCINEFPFFDSLKVEFKDKNIVFLQLSCDQAERRWRMGMSMSKRTADQFQWFINGNKGFMKDLMVATIPRYLLIDRKGKLIKSHMSRASESETKSILAALKGI